MLALGMSGSIVTGGVYVCCLQTQRMMSVPPVNIPSVLQNGDTSNCRTGQGKALRRDHTGKR